MRLGGAAVSSRLASAICMGLPLEPKLIGAVNFHGSKGHQVVLPEKPFGTVQIFINKC